MKKWLVPTLALTFVFYIAMFIVALQLPSTSKCQQFCMVASTACLGNEAPFRLFPLSFFGCTCCVTYSNLLQDIFLLGLLFIMARKVVIMVEKIRVK